MDLVDMVNGKTALLGLIGCPVEHTKSPLIHNTLLKAFKINAIYIPVHVEPDGLGKAVEGFKAQNFAGFNVTVPHKKDIIKYLDDISEEARLIGAVNTVKIKDGRLMGYNTDAEGFARDFKDTFAADFKGKRVMLLGAGGTARALSVKLAAEGVQHLTIVNRTLQNAQNIAELVNKNFGAVVSSVTPEDSEFQKQFKQYEFIINTTPAGMSSNDRGHTSAGSKSSVAGECPLYDNQTPFGHDFEFNKNQIVYDVIYSPPKTKFLQLAEACGCKTANGFGMLINQGVSAFEIWTGQTVSRQHSVEILNLILKIEDL